MKLGVPKETFPGEHRVAIVPPVLPALKKLGIDVVIERGAGEAAGFPDSAYADTAAYKADQLVIGFAEPLTAIDAEKAIAARGTMLAAMELVPRITRAQSMDALSSMA